VIASKVNTDKLGLPSLYKYDVVPYVQEISRMVAGEIVPTNVTHVHFEYPCNFRPPGLEIDEIVVFILFLGDLF
jgi:hypothetical protein